MNAKDTALQAARDSFKAAGGRDALIADLLSLSADVEPDMIEPGATEPTIDCRLRHHDGSWSFHTGDSSYDTDHRGNWGASCVGADMTEDEAGSVADDLLDQVLDSLAQNL